MSSQVLLLESWEREKVSGTNCKLEEIIKKLSNPSYYDSVGCDAMRFWFSEFMDFARNNESSRVEVENFGKFGDPA
jgi:hypothetical protein